MTLPMEYLPFLLIGLLTLLQLWMRLSARRLRGRRVDGLEAYLSPDQLNARRVIIYFSSGYCQPCQQLAPLIERLISEGGEIVKLDAIEQGALATRLGARGAPAFVMLEQGVVTKVHLGSLTEAQLRTFLRL